MTSWMVQYDRIQNQFISLHAIPFSAIQQQFAFQSRSFSLFLFLFRPIEWLMFEQFYNKSLTLWHSSRHKTQAMKHANTHRMHSIYVVPSEYNIFGMQPISRINLFLFDVLLLLILIFTFRILNCCYESITCLLTTSNRWDVYCNFNTTHTFNSL